MSEITTGIRSVLSHPRVYEGLQRLLGAETGRARFVADHVRPRAGERVLDLGCGPGEMLTHLEGTRYVGVDLSAEYIERAKARFGKRGEFHVGDVTEIADDLGRFDVVISVGVLHHLDDDGVRHMLSFAADALGEGGRVVTLDPTHAEGQSPIATAVQARDRGQHIRRPAAYAALANEVFGDVRRFVRGDLNAIPYTHCALECRSPRSR